MAFGPEAVEVVDLAGMVGGELQDRRNSLIPELFVSFDAAVDLFDCRLDMAVSSRKSGLALFVVLYAGTLFLEVPQRAGNDSGWGRLITVWRWSKLLVSAFNDSHELVYLPAPKQLCPMDVIQPRDIQRSPCFSLCHEPISGMEGRAVRCGLDDHRNRNIWVLTQCVILSIRKKLGRILRGRK